jgi:hypothetical protein
VHIRRVSRNKAVKFFIDSNIFRQGSLVLTYPGIIYITSESLLILLEEGKKFISGEKIDPDDLEKTAKNIQDEPYDANLLHDFLQKLSSLLFSLPNTKLNSEEIESVANFLTNMLSSIIICATNDSDMRGLLQRRSEES